MQPSSTSGNAAICNSHVILEEKFISPIIVTFLSQGIPNQKWNNLHDP